MTFPCIAAWALALLLFPLIALAWATESRSTRINRWRSQGATWQQISDRLGCSRSTAWRCAAG